MAWRERKGIILGGTLGLLDTWCNVEILLVEICVL